MITMLRLKNIKVRNDYAEADFYPEDGNEAGHVVVDLTSGEITSCVDVPGYGASYSGHARQRLVSIAKQNTDCSECLVMWC